MIVSVTEIQTFMRCPQKWELTSFNRAGLEPIMKAPALSLGTLIHKTLEDWSTNVCINGLTQEDGSPETDPCMIYKLHSQEALANIVMAYRAQVGANPGGAELLGVTQAIELGSSMIKNYKEYWVTPVQPGVRLIKAEQTIKVPIPGTEHCECQNHECGCSACLVPDVCHELGCECVGFHILESTLDGLMIDDRSGAYYIRENKTFAAHPSIQELRRNFQFLCYTWAAREFFKSDVRGLAYDGLWKRAHIPTDAKGKPRINQATHSPYTLDDLFLRTTLVPSQAELDALPAMLAIAANAMATYPTGTGKNYLKAPVRVVPPVRGCVIDDKQNILLCDQLWRDEDASMTLRHYTKRERTLAFVGSDEDGSTSE